MRTRTDDSYSQVCSVSHYGGVLNEVQAYPPLRPIAGTYEILKAWVILPSSYTPTDDTHRPHPRTNKNSETDASDSMGDGNFASAVHPGGAATAKLLHLVGSRRGHIAGRGHCKRAHGRHSHERYAWRPLRAVHRLSVSAYDAKARQRLSREHRRPPDDLPQDTRRQTFEAGRIHLRSEDISNLQRSTRAEPPPTSFFTSSTVAIVVSPGVVIANAPWAAPYSTACCGSLNSMKP